MTITCRTIAFLLIAGSTLTQASLGPSAGATGPEIAIRNVLKSQVEAWNRHDLERFVTGYWNSPELTFFSGATETKGWQATLDRYRGK